MLSYNDLANDGWQTSRTRDAEGLAPAVLDTMEAHDISLEDEDNLLINALLSKSFRNFREGAMVTFTFSTHFFEDCYNSS